MKVKREMKRDTRGDRERVCQQPAWSWRKRRRRRRRKGLPGDSACPQMCCHEKDTAAVTRTKREEEGEDPKDTASNNSSLLKMKLKPFPIWMDLDSFQ